MPQTPPCYGASPDEWALFDTVLGLARDLLPVVANPNAVISPTSNIRDLGKVPSLYNRHGQVVGIAGWTARQSDAVDIDRWQLQRDYGICLQTREVRALDIDVPDAQQAGAIRDAVFESLGFTLPMRWRHNSGKCLLAFRIHGSLPKRVIRVREKIVDGEGKTLEAAWLVEFLANGQQFVAAGTHASGARIEWDGLEDFPVITLAQFNAVWLALEKRFACAPSALGAIRQRAERRDIPDPVAEDIAARGLDLGIGKDGQIFIECPWKDDHSMDSGITETAYFPCGTGGYALGHFKCMHAGCASRSDTDFEEILGLRDDMFSAVIVPPERDEQGKPIAALPPFTRAKNGDIEASLYNLDLALRRTDILGRELRYDTFRDEDMVKLPGKEWRPLTDADSVNLRRHLERFGFKPIGRELMRDAVTSHGAEHVFDTAIEWLNALPPWDGVRRIRRFLPDYFGADDTEYTQAIGNYLWTALAGRVLVPGIKADMAVILQGDQGAIKSTAIAAMSPTEDQFIEMSLGGQDADTARTLRGKTVVELGELRGLYSKEFEAIKAWIVSRFDEWVPKYKERTIRYMRRCIFIGTTNHGEFLVDETGHRRFLPAHVRRADIARVTADKLQLWAEGRAVFLAAGIQWQEAERLAKGEHSKFTVHDSWEEDITRWLDVTGLDGETPGSKGYITTGEVLRDALNIDARGANTANEKRVAKVLKTMGYTRTVRRVDGRPAKVFSKTE